MKKKQATLATLRQISGLQTRLRINKQYEATTRDVNALGRVIDELVVLLTERGELDHHTGLPVRKHPACTPAGCQQEIAEQLAAEDDRPDPDAHPDFCGVHCGVACDCGWEAANVVENHIDLLDVY